MAGLIYRGFILLFVLVNAAHTERIKDLIYMPVEGVAACFRRHNGTHQFGCSSSRSGSVGVIHVIESPEELDWLEKSGNAGPYTAVVPFSMFTSDTLTRLRETNNINGVLLARNTSAERTSHYSPDDTCPNRYSGFKECEKPWNPLGSSLLVQDWPFPMFYLHNETLLQEVKSCFEKYNAHDREAQSERSLCALEMRSFMFSAVDSETCMRRNIPRVNVNPPQYCEPLGDRNVHWPVAPLENDTDVIMVTARLDASSLFEDLSPGAGSAVTGLVTLIVTAYYLNEMEPTVDKTNVVFSLLNGEAFDYIGSSRLVYDLKEGNFNALGGKTLRLDQIRTVIELGQVGDGDVYLHSSNYENDPLINGLSRELSATILKDSVPPASIQRFLAVDPSIKATVIANHSDQFTNRYYNSILDDAKSVDFVGNESKIVTSLNKIAFTLAKQLYLRVTGNDSTFVNSKAGEAHIASMLSCYLISAKCDLFRAASFPGSKLPNEVQPLYVGVNRWPSQATTLTASVLALLTGTEVSHFNQTTCQEHHLMWMNGFDFQGSCINTTVNSSIATSPAFVIDGYDMKSGKYSTWTESVWQGLSMRMFLKPSAGTERLSMIFGCIITVLSFIVVWFIQSRADLLFNSIGTADC